MSLVDETHSEDVKAMIRKRYRSLARFEKAEGLARQSVTEVLRGRPSGRTKAAIERVLRDEKARTESIIPVDSNAAQALHRLNAESR